MISSRAILVLPVSSLSYRFSGGISPRYIKHGELRPNQLRTLRRGSRQSISTASGTTTSNLLVVEITLNFCKDVMRCDEARPKPRAREAVFSTSEPERRFQTLQVCPMLETPCHAESRYSITTLHAAGEGGAFAASGVSIVGRFSITTLDEM